MPETPKQALPPQGLTEKLAVDATASSAEANDYYQVYEEHAKGLRTWLVAYGIGGPVLLLTNDHVATRIAASGDAKRLGLFFLIGVSAQVVLATVNKTIMWASYYAATRPEFRRTRRYRFSSWLSEQFWIDFLIDLVSLGFFGCATYRAFEALTR